ncbi:MAG: methyltransferase [Rhodomicrobiaceae bacterium]
MSDRTSKHQILRVSGLAYAALAFIATFAFFGCFVMFLGNLPKLSQPWLWPSVDRGPELPLLAAAVIDFGLIALFGLQHSLMARPLFKARWTRVVPEGLERSTYVLAASAAGFIMLSFWRPIPIVLWEISGPVSTLFWAAFALGWLILLAAAISFDIFELLGLRQAWAWYRGRPAPLPKLKTHWLYKWLTHPMYLGVLIGLWVTPVMTAGHVLMALTFTVYILIAKRYEERDLTRTFGTVYRSWRREPRARQTFRLHF